jgi:hypothetical protein
VDPSFHHLLSSWDLSRLDSEEGSVYGLWDDLRIGLTSSGWERFARENNGADILDRYPPGASILPAIPDPLRPLYQQGWSTARSGQLWHHNYDCSSPSEYRRFRMQIFPLEGGKGMLVVNTLIESLAISQGPYPPQKADPDSYISRGILLQCCHCRRFRVRPGLPGDPWRWVGEWLSEAPAPISHGLCPTCMAYHYPDMPRLSPSPA